MQIKAWTGTRGWVFAFSSAENIKLNPVARKWVEFETKVRRNLQPRFLYLETRPVYQSITDVHSKETQLRKPEMTA